MSALMAEADVLRAVGVTEEVGGARGSERVAHRHFPRLWADRNDDRVHVFANGHVYDRAERRRGLRQLIGMMRRERA